MGQTLWSLYCMSQRYTCACVVCVNCVPVYHNIEKLLSTANDFRNEILLISLSHSLFTFQLCLLDNNMPCSHSAIFFSQFEKRLNHFSIDQRLLENHAQFLVVKIFNLKIIFIWILNLKRFGLRQLKSIQMSLYYMCMRMMNE